MDYFIKNTEFRVQKTKIKNQTSDVRNQKLELRGQTSENRCQTLDFRKNRIKSSSVFCLLFSVLCSLFSSSAIARWKDEGQSERYFELWQKSYQWEASAIQGYHHMLNDEYEEAQRLFDLAVHQGCDLGKVHFQLGLCLSKLGKTELARDRYQSAITILSETKENLSDEYLALSYFNLGLIEAGLDHSQKSIAAFENASQIDPSEPKIHFNLGLLYFEEERKEEAFQAFHESLKLGFEMPILYLYLSQILKEQGKRQEAEQYLEKAQAMDPMISMQLISEAKFYTLDPKGVFDPFLLEDLQASTKNPEHLMGIANIYYTQEYYPQARQIYGRILKTHPEHSEAHAQLGRTLMAMGKERLGIVELKKAAEDSPNDEHYLILIGKTLYDLGRIQKAKPYFEEALSKNAENSDALFYLGVIHGYVDEKRYAPGFPAEEAIRYFRRVLELNPESLESITNLANIYARSGRWDEAKNEFSIASIKAGDSAYAHYNLGFMYDDLGLYRLSIEEYKKATQLDEKFVDAYFNMGYVYSELKLLDEALKQYKKVLSLNRDYADAYFNLGVLYDRYFDDKRKAFVYYHEYGIRSSNAPLAEKRILKRRIIKLYP